MIKKAKPALCFARIAKAILGSITLHNSNFLLNKRKQLLPQIRIIAVLYFVDC
jgi:hypothetical protein